MAITDRDRRHIFTRLEATIGSEAADHLMQLLPNEPTDQLVTRSDMDAFGTGLRGEMAELRGELRGEMAELRAELRGEMAELRAELRGEMAELRTELRGEMAELRAEVHVEISRLEAAITEFSTEIKTHTTRAIVGGVAVNVVAVLGAVGLT